MNGPDQSCDHVHSLLWKSMSNIHAITDSIKECLSILTKINMEKREEVGTQNVRKHIMHKYQKIQNQRGT